MTRTTLAVTLAALLCGCRTTATPPEGAVESREMYQAVANALPRASFGWGSPPGVVGLAASTKAEGPAPAPEPPLANARGVRVVVEVYRPRSVTIPFAAVEQVTYAWRTLPNALLAPLLVVPLQAVRATVVFDARQVDGFLPALERDIARLEAISREVGMGGPWGHAQGVKAKLADDAAEYGPGRVAMHFDYFVPLPAAIPYRTPARRTAEAFAWCAAQAARPPAPAEAPSGPTAGW
ncbi:MAG: hypothetical protein M9894_19120 [Planctomycetes bacterium]|nr:hypothetical protein [Planctomycetota bacterium]